METQGSKAKKVFSLDEVAAIEKKLLAMPALEKPKKQDLTKAETVARLSKAIQTLQGRNYSLEQIAESLKGLGLEITTPVLKNYLHRAKAKSEEAKKATKRIKGKAHGEQSPVSTIAQVESEQKGTFVPTPDTPDSDL